MPTQEISSPMKPANPKTRRRPAAGSSASEMRLHGSDIEHGQSQIDLANRRADQ
jgi:hypothetical protein